MSQQFKSNPSGASRRSFIVKSIVGALGGLQLSACGGGGGATEETEVIGGGGSNPVPEVKPGPRPVDTANVLRVSLPSGSESNYPLQFGRPFVKGEIADTPLVFLDDVPVTAQVDVKTRHADGSVRFAVVSMVLPTLGTTERTIRFGNQTAPVSSPATVASMLADYDFDATINVENAGGSLAGSPISARAMLSALSDAALSAETAAGGTQSRFWTSGPICTSVILCDHAGRTYDLGTNGTRALRPIFHVQFWPTIKRFHVRHVLEVADVTKLKDELGLTVTFSTGRATPAVRLSQTGVNFYVGTWQSRAWWGGSDLPVANVVHDVAYLARTGAIPNHDPSIVMNAAALSSYATDWAARSTSLQATGYWTKAMATTGGRPDIGLMPKWDVVTMYSGAAHMHVIGQAHAELAGSWAFFFREGDAFKTTFGTHAGLGRVVSKLSRPTAFLYDGNGQILSGNAGDKFFIDGVATTSRDGWAHDHAHTPGMFWWQYLSTGQAFWHEKLLQLAAWSQFVVNPGLSFNTVGNGESNTSLILNGVQVRGWGWQFRNRARAWWAALDGSPEQQLFDKSLRDAIAQRVGIVDIPGEMVGNPIRDAWNDKHATWYATGPVPARPNPLGYWDRKGVYTAANFPGGVAPSNSNGTGNALWMQNFVTLSLGHAVDLGYVEAKPLLQWSAKLVLGIANSKEPRHVADYAFPDVKSTGEFYQSLDDIYDNYSHDANDSLPPSMPALSTAGFAGGGAPNTYGVTVEGYGSISSAAVAMAHDAPGRDSAWNVISDWHRNTVYYSHDPRYAILPRQ